MQAISREDFIPREGFHRTPAPDFTPEKIREQTAHFLASGGQIQYLPACLFSDSYRGGMKVDERGRVALTLSDGMGHEAG